VIKLYKYISDVPEEKRSVIERMVRKGILETPNNEINIDEDMLRIFIIMDRLGLI